MRVFSSLLFRGHLAEVAGTAANTSVAGFVASAGRGLAAWTAVPHGAGVPGLMGSWWLMARATLTCR